MPAPKDIYLVSQGRRVLRNLRNRNHESQIFLSDGRLQTKPRVWLEMQNNVVEVWVSGTR